jgi:hypothetical protein
MPSNVVDKADYDVLNVVALKKMTDPTTIAQVAGTDASTVAPILADLAGRGLVVVAGDAALPTDDAEPALAAAAAVHYGELRGDEKVLGLVDKFETVNTAFLHAMSSWQQIEVGGKKVTNDHSDAEYDDEVISKLDRLVGRLRSLITALAEHDARFGTYTTRFESSIDLVDTGRHEFVSSPVVDSVHNVWFEFHEDLLRTLGRERVE